MSQKKKEVQPLTGNDVCILVHTAMRKYCDSPATTCAYNLIHLIGDIPIGDEVSPWLFYGAVVAETLNAVKKHTPKMLASVVKEAAEKLRDLYWERIELPLKKGDKKVPDTARTALYALTASLRLFDAKDWEGVAYLLIEEA